jgi:two-component system phosphate regulon sensor histidine kinase PhoR
MRRKRLLWQLYLSYLLITLASLAVVTWYASSALRQFYIDRTRADLEARALLIEQQVRAGLAQREFSHLDALCKQLGHEASTRVTVILPSGKVVADSEESPGAMENHADRPEIIEALAGGTGKAEHYSRTLHEDRMYVAIPVGSAGTILGVLRTSIPMTMFEQTLRTVQLRIAVGGLLAAGLVAGVSLLLSRRISRPLEELKDGAERFARGELTYKLPVADSEEIGSLAEALNHMAEELNDKIGNVVEQRNERDAILSSMVEGVVAVDTQERLIRVNQAAARLIGVDSRAAAGRTLQEVIRNPELQQLAARVLASSEPREDEIVLRHNGERYLHVQGTILRDARDQPMGMLLVLHDVTRLKRLEIVRRDFVANVSHELRTPVTSIKGFVETLLDGAMHNPDELKRFLQIVASQTDRLNAILEDLLTLSRIEQEEESAQIVVSPGAVKDVLDAALEVCRKKASEKDIRTELTCDSDLRAPMNAPLLEQAVINLIDNAIKYSLPGQTIHVAALRSDAEVVIEVRDHGCGISRQHLPRIFERFYRVDKARSRNLGGTGLGLAIVKHIARAHGGRATVESTVGQGSRFSIHLPLPER